MKAKLKQIGETIDNAMVVSNVFKLYDTNGVPLELIVEEFKANNVIVAWDVFYEDALKAGWKESNIEAKMLAAINDNYDKEYLEGFKKSFENWKATNANNN